MPAKPGGNDATSSWATPSTATASPALTNGAYEFELKRLEPAPELSPNRLVFKVPPSRIDRCGSNGAQT